MSTPGAYARARLRLGMTGVGLFTLLGLAVSLGLVGDGWLPAESVDWRGDLSALLSLFGVYALLHLPLDLLGGWILPRRHGRPAPSGPGVLVGWARGLAVQGAVMVGAGMVLLALGRSQGDGAALAGAALLMLVLVTFQERLVRWTGGFASGVAAPPAVARSLRAVLGRDVPAFLWAGRDPGFTGGWFGLPGRERLVLPAHWVEGLTAAELSAEVTRRAEVLRSGARTRGLAVAAGFVLAGLALAASLPAAGFASPAALVRTALAFTVWSFVGLLVLPSLSRAAVFGADALAALRGVPRGVLEHLIQRLDRWQDDEPARSRGVETIFHPIPSVERRLAALSERATPAVGAWHAARMMLFLSWVGLGLLSRAVHCNSGRPELWAALPAD